MKMVSTGPIMSGIEYSNTDGDGDDFAKKNLQGHDEEDDPNAWNDSHWND